MKQCPNGHAVGDNVKFCPECGAEIIENGARFCAKCGNERKGTEKFCSQCGTPYGKSPTSNVSETRVRQNKSSKKGILIAAVVAVIALLGGAAWYFLGNQNKYSLEGLAKAAVNYDYIDDFHEGFAMVYKGEKVGFIDKMGNEVIPCEYDFKEDKVDANCFIDGLALVRKGDKTCFINKEGKEAFPFNYGDANCFSEGLAVVWKDGKSGYIDTNGKEVIALTDKYSYDNFSEGLAAVSQGDKYGFIDKKGNIAIPIKYELQGEMGETSSFHNGLAMIIKNGKCGFIDTKGNEVISCKYDYAYDFCDGMALIMKNEKYGYIDKSGNEVIPCEYSYANHFSEGIAVVKKDDKYQYIDKNGKVVLENSYSGISKFQEGFAVVYKEGKKNEYYQEYVHGFIDKEGKEVIPCIYNSCNLFSEGLAVVEKDGIYGFVDKKGNSTFSLQDEEVKKIIQAKIQEKEEARKEEERRAEEERIEQERRRGVEKEVTLSCTKGDGLTIMSQDRLSGNYGAYSTGWYVRSYSIKVPINKVWVFDKYEIIEGHPSDIALFYFSRLSQRNESDAKYELNKGNVPIFRSGDRIMISFKVYYSASTYSIRVLFKEKDEDLYF